MCVSFIHLLVSFLLDSRGQFMLGGYMVIMLVLFTNFYIHEYVTRSNDKKRRQQKLKRGDKASDDEELSATPSARPNGVKKTKKT